MSSLKRSGCMPAHMSSYKRSDSKSARMSSLKEKWRYVNSNCWESVIVYQLNWTVTVSQSSEIVVTVMMKFMLDNIVG